MLGDNHYPGRFYMRWSNGGVFWLGCNLKLNRPGGQTFRVITFGCPVNQGESAAIETAMQNEGFVKNNRYADIVIINSCVVTGSAAAEARRVARKAKRENRDTLVVLAGCYPQVYHNKLAGELPEVDIFIGTKGRSGLPALVREHLPGGKPGPRVMVENHGRGDRFEEMPYNEGYRRTRPVVKIQEGCNEHCTYCIVRQARGRSRSLAADKVLDQVRALLEAGRREIILAGNQLGLYGLDLDEAGIDLPEIVEKVSGLPYDFRIRLGYVEPMNITEKLLETVAGNPRVCKYLYIPVQSCSDRVLKKMGRRYRAADFAAIVERAKALAPGIGLWTDLIAGFPGEDEADHAATVKMVRDLALSHLHVFPYSLRPGTPAERMGDNVPPDVKKRRAAQLQELGRELSLTYHLALVGSEQRVLVERVVDAEDGRFAEGYAGNHVLVKIPLETLPPDRVGIVNRFVTVRVKEAHPGWVTGGQA